MLKKGLLLVTVDPPPILEEELNAWYDTEHLPERVGLPGFETALRFQSVGDGPKYLALYDLTDLEALETPDYDAVSGDNFSPWTKRVATRSRSIRLVGEQIHPGDRITSNASARISVIRLMMRAENDAVLINQCKSLADRLGVRLFKLAAPDDGQYLMLIEHITALDLANLEAELAKNQTSILAVSTFRPYRP